MENSVQVIWTFILDYTKGWGVRRHHHDYFQMYYCLSGTGLLYLDGEEIELSSNVCLIICPDQIHEIYPIKSGQLRIIDTKFYVRDAAIQQAILDAPKLITISDTQFRELQHSMRNEWVSNGVYGHEMATLLFQQSLYQFLRKSASVPSKIPFYKELEDCILKLTGLEKNIADYLLLHFLEELSLDKIAGDLRYSKNHLCKVFKNATGYTISEYTNFLRIRKAYDLICCTDKKLSEISLTCGFSSIHYFSRTFRKITGLSPSQARDQDRNSIYTDIRLHGTFHYRYFTENV